MHTIDEQLKIIGLIVKKARIYKKYPTQKKFAKKLTSKPNPSATIISRIETGKDLDFIKFLKVARILELPLRYFFTSENIKDIEIFRDPLSLEERHKYKVERIGNIIKEKREKLNKTLLDFESNIGLAKIDSSDLSKIERGKSNFRISLLIRICTELDLKIKDLF